MLNAGQFIALAEETGDIVPLGSWVLRQAVADIVRLQRSLPREPPLYMSVNVSARQFADPEFVAGVRAVVAESGLDRGPTRSADVAGLRIRPGEPAGAAGRGR